MNRRITFKLNIMLKVIYQIVFYLLLGIIVSVLQAFVLNGLPLQIRNDFWGEILFSSVYIFFLIQLQKRLLHSFIIQFKRNTITIERFIKYFLLIQAGGAILLFAIGFILNLIILGVVAFKLRDFDQLRFILVYYFFINTIIYCVGIGLRLYSLYNKEKDAKHNAEKSFLSAQLQMLRQQLNPHFLFNNLNIIASTIHNNPKLAYDFTKSMASFYRKVLETENEGWVTLKAELKTIQSYLYMLEVRFEEKLVFSIDVPQEIQERYLVPDFILQPIVENAVKHNICTKNRPLQIIITINEAGHLLIKNNYQPKDVKSDSIGIGWFNIENRYKYLEAKAPIKYIKDYWFYVEVWLIEDANM
jgi:two-component system, LytTR family, sensor kinase